MEDKNNWWQLSDKVVRNVCIGFLALGLVLGAYGLDTILDRSRVQPWLSPGLSDRVEFRPGRKHVEKPRSVHYENGVLKSAEVPYEDGGKALIEYFTAGQAKGKISWARLFYPLVEGKREAQVERELFYDADGQNIRTDRLFREDGSLLHAGDKSGDLFIAYDYRIDGHTVEKHQEFSWIDSAWKAILEEQFYPDMKLAKSFKLKSDGSSVTSTFSRDEQLLSSVVVDKWSSNAKTVSYEADGKTIKMQATETVGGVIVETYTHGLLLEEREFVYGPIQGVPLVMWVIKYDTAGVPLYRQKWLMDYTLAAKVAAKPPVHLESSMYTLSQVQYLNAKGVTKDIDFYEDGHTPRVVEIHDAPPSRYPGTIKSFRKDGTLEKVKVHNAERETVKVEQVDAEKQVFEALDADSLKDRPFDDPPHLVKRVPYSSYGYEGM